MVPLFADPFRLGVELIYTIGVVVLCLAIYWRTREIYNLSAYTGIKFFRDAFLFFGLSYLARFLFGMLWFSKVILDIGIPSRTLGLILLVGMGYLSSVAIMYLVLGSVWKHAEQKIIIRGHVLAIILPLIALLMRSPEVLLGLQTILLVIAGSIGLRNTKGAQSQKPKNSQKSAHKSAWFSKAKVFYVSMFVFWLMNLWLMVPRGIFSQELKLVFQAISLIVFGMIYYTVAKWVR